MTKKEAIQILQDREEQIAGLVEAFSEGNTFDWVGCVLSAIMKGVPEAIDVLMDCESGLREAGRKQAVDVEWQAGHKIINVSGDSDTAMIRDVIASRMLKEAGL